MGATIHVKPNCNLLQALSTSTWSGCSTVCIYSDEFTLIGNETQPLSGVRCWRTTSTHTQVSKPFKFISFQPHWHPYSLLSIPQPSSIGLVSWEGCNSRLHLHLRFWFFNSITHHKLEPQCTKLKSSQSDLCYFCLNMSTLFTNKWRSYAPAISPDWIYNTSVGWMSKKKKKKCWKCAC